MQLAAHNISVDLPPGWDGRIYARRTEDVDGRHALRSAATRPTAATLHAANFALPQEDGDFGTTATATMAPPGAFLTLTEYVPGGGLHAGQGLFAKKSIPRSLRAQMFSPRNLLLARPGQVGLQHFFTTQDRPFCLYLVLGSSSITGPLLQQVNRVLDSLTIEERELRPES